MKLRSLTLAGFGLLIAITAACGSDSPAKTTAAAAGDQTMITAPSETTTSTSSASAVVGGAETESSSGASPPDQPAAGRLTPTVPTQTMTTLPSDSFLVTYGGVSYYCEPQGYSDDESDCVRYYGGSAPYVGSPDLYCSDSVAPECSDEWYPAELEDADMVTMGGRTYVCQDALVDPRVNHSDVIYCSHRLHQGLQPQSGAVPVDLRRPPTQGRISHNDLRARPLVGGSSFGDKECALYSGGDPDSVSFVLALKCSPSGGSLQCDDKYFPSVWKGLTQVQIGYDDYICKSSYAGKECWEWAGYGNPKSATYGLPDLYCNPSGTCDDHGYPSRY